MSGRSGLKENGLDDEVRKLLMANEALSFQNEEKERIIAGLITANQQLTHENAEKEKKALALAIANNQLKEEEDKILKANEESIGKLNEELEQKILERTGQLETAVKELEAFSYSVSHDLRAPLRAVNGFAVILEEAYSGVLDSEGMRLLKIIQENANKMGVLIDDLLAFSRLGKKEINSTIIDMTSQARNALYNLKNTLKIKAEVKINKLHPVLGDTTLINQVWMNLLSNAVKYSSKNEAPVITVKSTKKNGEVVYSVADNGVGFDMKYAHKLFGVFQRLHDETDFEGTGVGLALVQRIINKHGGKIWANAKVGKGATFYFSIPEK